MPWPDEGQLKETFCFNVARNSYFLRGNGHTVFLRKSLTMRLLMLWLSVVTFAKQNVFFYQLRQSSVFFIRYIYFLPRRWTYISPSEIFLGWLWLHSLYVVSVAKQYFWKCSFLWGVFIFSRQDSRYIWGVFIFSWQASCYIWRMSQNKYFQTFVREWCFDSF